SWASRSSRSHGGARGRPTAARPRASVVSVFSFPLCEYRTLFCSDLRPTIDSRDGSRAHGLGPPGLLFQRRFFQGKLAIYASPPGGRPSSFPAERSTFDREQPELAASLCPTSGCQSVLAFGGVCHLPALGPNGVPDLPGHGLAAR